MNWSKPLQNISDASLFRSDAAAHIEYYICTHNNNNNTMIFFIKVGINLRFHQSWLFFSYLSCREHSLHIISLTHFITSQLVTFSFHLSIQLLILFCYLWSLFWCKQYKLIYGISMHCLLYFHFRDGIHTSFIYMK